MILGRKDALRRIGAAVAWWVIADTLLVLRWERKHPDEIAPWRLRELDRRVQSAFDRGYSVLVVEGIR